MNSYKTPIRSTVHVRAWRLRAGLTQRELSTALNTGISTITQWEHKGTQPSSRLLPRMAEVFGCTIGDLYQDAAELMNGQ